RTRQAHPREGPGDGFGLRARDVERAVDAVSRDAGVRDERDAAEVAAQIREGGELGGREREREVPGRVAADERGIEGPGGSRRRGGRRLARQARRPKRRPRTVEIDREDV